MCELIRMSSNSQKPHKINAHYHQRKKPLGPSSEPLTIDDSTDLPVEFSSPRGFNTAN